MSIGIYKLVFSGTDKVYIGQSIDIEARFKQHIYSLSTSRASSKMLRAYSAHGLPQLKVLQNCSIKELNLLEIQYISEYNSVKNGFNSVYGGSSIIGADNPNCNNTIEDYYNVLVQLGTPGISWKQISKSTGVSEYIVSHISALESHRWMEEAFPEEYAKLKYIHGTSGRNSAFMQGIRYPNIVSPTGEIFEVKCPTHFAKEHSLLQPKLHEVLVGNRDTHKGWHLEGYTHKYYPSIIDPEGNIHYIKKGDAVIFANNNNISVHSLRNVLSKKQKSYNGWRLVDLTKNELAKQLD